MTLFTTFRYWLADKLVNHKRTLFVPAGVRVIFEGGASMHEFDRVVVEGSIEFEPAASLICGGKDVAQVTGRPFCYKHPMGGT